MSIRYLRKEEIDAARWDDCIRKSIIPLPYALFGYLEQSSNGLFGGLIADDYEAVMPVPWKGSSIVQPFISQQLGVFAKGRIEPMPFYQKLMELSRHIELKIHDAPGIQLPEDLKQRSRTNFILALNRDYESIFKNYSKTLRKRLRKQKDQVRLTEDIPLADVIDNYKLNLENKVSIGPGRYEHAERIFNYCLREGLARTYAVNDIEGQCLANGIFLIFEGRIINVFASSTAEGMTRNGMALLLDALFEKHAGAARLFDFEGSDIPGVKAFFQSFGPQLQTYLSIAYDRRSGIKKIWDRVSQSLLSG